MRDNDMFFNEEVIRANKSKNSKKHKRHKKQMKQLKNAVMFFSVGVIIIASSYGLFGNSFTEVSSNGDFSKTVDFDSSSIEYRYSYDKIKTDFRDVNFVKGMDRLFVKEDALWVHYPMVGSGISNSGAMINSKIASSKEYTLEYEIFFDGCGNSFDWQDGGVLSGLAGGEFYDGSESTARKDGFHAMLTYNNYGYIYPLVYTTSDKNVDGMLFQNIGKINENSWNKIRMYVKINDAGQDNGIFRVWLNDNLCFNNETITYTTSDKAIDTNNLCVYNNETDKTLANEQFVYVDNYYLSDKAE